MKNWLLAFLLGVALTTHWNHRKHPIQPLYVEIYNATANTLPEVTIVHGKVDLQETIQLFQLKSREHRTVSLNHAPGLGFNIDATLASGKKLTICAGKGEAAFVRATITSLGIEPLPIR